MNYEADEILTDMNLLVWKTVVKLGPVLGHLLAVQWAAV